MIDELEIVGQPPELDFVKCEALICEQYWHQGELKCPANLIYLQVGPIWHCLTFDCGIIFWRTQSDPPKPCVMPELEAEAKLDDVGSRLDLAGRVLETYEASAIPDGSQVVFKFKGGRQIAFKDVHDTTTIVA